MKATVDTFSRTMPGRVVAYAGAFAIAAGATSSAWADLTIPDETKVRVRLDQTISSVTAEEGRTVELTITEPVRGGRAMDSAALHAE